MNPSGTYCSDNSWFLRDEEEETKLGSKELLERLVYDITGVPARALYGELPDYDITIERMAWVLKQETAKLADMVYLQLEIFSAQVLIIYRLQLKKESKK
jgi:hypothetical protein